MQDFLGKFSLLLLTLNSHGFIIPYVIKICNRLPAANPKILHSVTNNKTVKISKKCCVKENFVI